jgi:hypothetical protein
MQAGSGSVGCVDMFKSNLISYCCFSCVICQMGSHVKAKQAGGAPANDMER